MKKALLARLALAFLALLLPVLSIAQTQINLQTQVKNVLPASNGGTGTATASANTVLAGPISGGATAAAMRALVAADLPLFGTAVAGAVPASGGGTTNYLRADGTWTAAMVYPGSGIANSTGTGWGTSYATTGSGSVVLSTSPALTTPTFSTAATITAGTNAQGQGALTNDNNIITTTANNPSGNTLQTAVAGLRVRVVNAGTNPINVYPATGAQIDSLGSNNPQQIPVGGALDFQAASSTQWYSSLHASTAQAYVFTSGTSFTVPTGAKFVDVICIGGGGGGGSGARQATTSARYGGGGGGSGGISIYRTSAPNVAFTYAVGAPGTGGASVTTDTTNGANGVAGGQSSVNLGGTYVCRANGGALGSGGTTSTGSAGAAGGAMIAGGAGGAGTSTTGTTPDTSFSTGAGGGGGGAAASSTTTAAGGQGSGVNAVAGGSAGGAGTNGTALTSVSSGSVLLAGGGGGGGGSYATAQATGAGGTGGAYGGGGGGGAASDNTFASGAGGAGGSGAVIFIVQF